MEQYQNQNEPAALTDTISNSRASLAGRLRFEQFLRTLEACPDLLASECREANKPRDYQKIRTALDRWKAAGFPGLKEPPQEWVTCPFAYLEKWVDDCLDQQRGMEKITPDCNQIPNAAALDFLNDVRCSVEGELVEAAYCPSFADWLLWLESSEHLLMKEAGNPRTFAWVKSLLSRWQAAGRPCPSEWPETRNLRWLRPVRSTWPEIKG